MSDKLTKDNLVPIVTHALPYPGQISNWDSELGGERSIYFEWRGDCFKVTIKSGGHGIMVEESTHQGRMLTGSNISILLEALIKQELINVERRSLNVC